MRVLYGPLANIFAPKAPKMNMGPSAADQKAAEDRAAEEAQRKARADAANRQGSRQSLLASPGLEDTFGENSTRRKTIFGG